MQVTALRELKVLKETMEQSILARVRTHSAFQAVIPAHKIEQGLVDIDARTFGQDMKIFGGLLRAIDLSIGFQE